LAYKKEQSDYKKDKPISGRGLGPLYRSGYIATKDMMAPYRKLSLPESEYFRRVKENVRASEVKGPSGFSDSFPRYVEKLPRNAPEPSIWRGNLQEFAKSVLKDALKEIEEKTGEKEVPQKRYEQMRDAAVGTTEAIDSWIKKSEKTFPDNPDFLRELNEVKNKTEGDIKEVNEVLTKRQETILEDPVEFLKNPNVLGEPNNIKEEWSESKVEQENNPYENRIQFWKESGKLDYLIGKAESELNKLEGKLAETEDLIKSSGIGDFPQETVTQNEIKPISQIETGVPSIGETSVDSMTSRYGGPILPDSSSTTQRKKSSFGYDSEVGY